MTERIVLLNDVDNVLSLNDFAHDDNMQSLLLYGNSHLNNVSNNKILTATIKFIKSTGRFSLNDD